MSRLAAAPRTAAPSSRGWPRLRHALRRGARLALRALLLFVAVAVAQVLYVRFLPPLGTLTMAERKLEAWRKGQPASLERRWVGRDEIPDVVVQAVLAGEDDRFFTHHGFDWEEIRKAWRDNHRPRNQRAGRVRGASTLTQQTARNLFLWQARSWTRKGLEAFYTVLLELLVPKERILVLYLNVAEWGDRVFGVEAAARHWFHKPARALTATEAAMLSSSLPNPRRFPPTGDARYRRRRQEIIARRMQQMPIRPSAPGQRPRADVDEEDEDKEDGARDERRP